MKKKVKKIYQIDNCVYESEILYKLHKELKKAVEDKIINSFFISQKHSNGRFKTFKPIINNITFDSIMESRYYIYLLYLQKQNKVKKIELQKKYILQEKFKKNGKTFREITYIADFYYIDENNKEKVIDIKGKKTIEFNLKYKLFEYKYPNLTLELIQYSEKNDAWLNLDEINKEKRKRRKTK